MSAVDTEAVREMDTVYMTGTLENTKRDEEKVTVVGEISDDGEEYRERREVTVPADSEVDFNLKVRYPTGIYDVYSYDACVETDPDEPADRSDGFHDLVVVGQRSLDDDDINSGRPDLTATVENRAEDSRTGTLEAIVEVSDSPYSAEREITVRGGDSDSVDVTVNVGDPPAVYTYSSGAKIR